MDTNINLVAFIFGAILLVAAITGGGHKIKEIELPSLSWFSRVISAFFGVFFTFYVGLQPSSLPEQPSKTNSEKAQVSSDTLENDNKLLRAEIVKLKSEAAQAIERESGKKLDEALNQLLHSIEQAKASQQTDGLIGVIKITWTDLDISQTGFVVMNGDNGALRTSYINPENNNIEVIDQDLSIKNIDGGFYLVGSNPRFADTLTSNTEYAPDIFQLQINQTDNSYSINAVCDTNLTCSNIKTESIF